MWFLKLPQKLRKYNFVKIPTFLFQWKNLISYILACNGYIYIYIYIYMKKNQERKKERMNIIWPNLVFKPETIC
jgi:hypothetical protein